MIDLVPDPTRTYPRNYLPLDFDAAFEAYVECALWTASCNGQADHDGCQGEDCDINLDTIGYDRYDLAPETYTELRNDLAYFIDACLAERPHIFDGITPVMIGHDFCLTRNHHGAGFWDRGLGERGDWLTKQSDPYGESDLYVGDDGNVYA